MKKQTSWYQLKGPDQDIVLSSRVRFARNIAHKRFPHLLDATEAAELADEIIAAVKTIDPCSFHYLPLDQLDPTERQTLAERHLISPNLIAEASSRWLLINQTEDLSVLIHEEDHLRIQGMAPGFQLQEAYQKAERLTVALESVLSLACDREIGYLTSCPTNVGTGIRASALLHIPGLDDLGKTDLISDTLRKAGFTVRGYYGEGTSSQGHMVQISNQITLGHNCRQILERLKHALRLVIQEERRAREQLQQAQGIKLADRIYRSYGVLAHAKLISRDEAFACLSDLRLGMALGYFQDLSYPLIHQMLYLIGTGAVQKKTGQILAPQARDEARAQAIQRCLIPGDETGHRINQ